MNQDQIFYLKEVLGISTVLVPVSGNSAAVEVGLTDSYSPPNMSLMSSPHSSPHSVLQSPMPYSASLPLLLRVRVRGALAQARLIAIWERAQGVRSGEAEILVEKMVSAMKVPSPQVLWVDWDPVEGAQLPPEIFALLDASSVGACPVLIFGEHTARSVLTSTAASPLGRWLTEKGVRYMVTLSPEELLESTEKKRVAWAHLQTVMKAL